MKTIPLLRALALLLLISAATLHAQVPQIINYQGRVVVGTTNFNGTGQFKFALVSNGTNTAVPATATATVDNGLVKSVTVTNGGAGYTSTPAVTFGDMGGSGATATASVSGGAVTEITVNNEGSGYTQFTSAMIAPPPANMSFTTYWSHDGTSVNGSEPFGAGGPVSLPVTNGLYSVLLGDTTLPQQYMTPIPNSVFANPDVRLRVWFNDGVNGSQLLTPDQRIAAVGYAMMAGNVPDGAIGSAKIATGAVGSTQLATSAVQAGNIADGAVGSSQIAAGAVGAVQLAAGSITATQLAKPPRSGSIDFADMQINFNEARFTVPFVPALVTSPVVTLGIKTSTPWLYPVWLESSDTDSFTGRFIGPPLEPSVPDALGSVGSHSSLAVVNGNPAISYYDGTNYDLKFVRATDANGVTWGVPVTVAGDSVHNYGNPTASGYSTSLAVVNGNPAICYYETGTLKFARADDADGTSWWGLTMTLDTTGSGSYSSIDTSLVVINGNPAICYYDFTSQDLKFIRASDASGSTWDAPVTVDGSGSVGSFASMAVVNGNPAICYYDATNQDLKFVRASDASGTAWGTPQTLDSAGNVGRFGSLAVVNGNPAISYADGTNADLKFIRASDADGTTWATPITPDSVGGVGSYTSLAVIHGKPSICYRDSGNDDFKFVRAIDAAGNVWGTPIILESMGSVGFDPSMTMVNGNPAISYHDSTNADLKYLTTAMPSTFTIQWIALEP